MNVNTGLRENSWGQYPLRKGTTTSVLALRGGPRVPKKRKAGHRIAKGRRM